ncbi:MAG TPA: OmpA family protein [Bacteroidales bacterium]|nr:OmpA family protein [Bacteroidales bacterium]
MRKNSVINAIVIIIATMIVFACVPARQFEDVKAKKESCEAERNQLKKDNETLTTQNNEMKSQLDRFKNDLNSLVLDTAIKGNAYRTLTVQYDKINDLYAQLLENQEKLRQGADADAQKALAMLQQTREELQRKEDELRALEARLNQERANVEAMRIQNELKEKELADKNAKVQELQAKLDAQDSVMNALRKKVSDALVGFEGNGLTVTMKDGKVYVSLDEQLLFKSGKWDVDPKGVQALKNLAVVLETNPDINIMIEGHTDELAYGGNGNIEDNWDLSVKRATAIVKILLGNSKIDPKRLTAAGRSSYLPVDPAKTSEARAKNRRTEIILTPNLDELYKLMNQ